MIVPGNIVLFKYPYTDFSEEKRRPVLIVAERPDFEGEFLISFLTSQASDFNKKWDIKLDPNSARDSTTNLNKKTLIKPTKLMIISRSRMTGLLGRVHPDVLARVRGNIRDWLSQ